MDKYLTFYHGAANKYNTLKPVVYNDGHLLRKYSWSIFLFHDYKLAVQWAIFQAIDGIAYSYHLNYPAFRYERLGFDEYNMKIGVKLLEYEKFLKIIKSKKIKFYVYTAKVSINNISKLGLGNTYTQPEYTYDEEIKPSHTDIFVLTESLLNQCVRGIDDDNYYDWIKNRPNMRGIMKFLYKDNSLKRYGYVWDKVHSGELKPGDNLDPIINKWYVENEQWESIDIDYMAEDYIFDITYEASQKNSKKKKVTKSDIEKAKKQAYQQIIQSTQFRNATRGMNHRQKEELQIQIRNRVSDNIDEADIFDKYPYASRGACVLIAIAGTAFLAAFTADQIAKLIDSEIFNNQYVDFAVNEFFKSAQDAGIINSNVDLPAIDPINLDNSINYDGIDDTSDNDSITMIDDFDLGSYV